MLNYANLNDVEFEALCRDIMERILGVGLRRFGSGRDGGVDLTDDVENKSIIVQVKHYIKSDVNALISTLKKELPKVNEHCPEQYYICCSRELSHFNVNELYQCFREYMASDSNIVTLIEIDNFLKRAENIDILKKHYKLWLDSTGILKEIHNDKIFVDCETFLYDVNELNKLFVRTSAFDRALKVLEDNHTLCIIGDPGIGKSITSKMLVLHYAADGYRVRYTTDVADLTTLKASLRDDSNAKEIILLDDCFGQAYFEMKSSQSTELISLIKYVKSHPNKILILNSRVTIFQEAKERQRELMRSLEREDFKVFVLDINNLSNEEKAKILYNHLAFSGIPDEYFQSVRKDHRYRGIVFHRNYNPRIIEFVCSSNRYKTVSADQYFSFVMKHLDNPHEMWKDEYDDRLQPVDRILLQTVYSLTGNLIKASLTRLCFERRIDSIPTIDKTLDQFNRSLQRLSEGFIKIVDYGGVKYLSMRNPSVNDFLDGRISKHSEERAELIRNICMPYQLRLIPENERLSFALGLLQSGKIDSYIFEKEVGILSRTQFIGRCIILTGLCDNRYRRELQEYLISKGTAHSYFNSILPAKNGALSNLLLQSVWDYYDLKEFFVESNHLYTFLNKLEFESAVEFISACDTRFNDKKRAYYIMQVEDYLSNAIKDFCDVDASDYDFNIDVEEAVQNATYTYNGSIDVDEDEATESIEEEIREMVIGDLEDIIRQLPKNFWHYLDDLDKDDVSVSSADLLVEDYLTDPPGHYDPDDSKQHTDNNYSPVDAIFER